MGFMNGYLVAGGLALLILAFTVMTKEASICFAILGAVIICLGITWEGRERKWW